MVVDHDVDQYSTESIRGLREATEEFTKMLHAFTEQTALMHGGSAEKQAFEVLRTAVTNAAVAWQERAEEHSGQFILPLDDDLAYQPDEMYEDAEDGSEDDIGPVESVSVVSRWDLDVVDIEQLVASGRAAHQRNRPDEDANDAARAVQDAESAVRALLHEHGEPWYSIGGVQVVRGARVYFQLATTNESVAGKDVEGAGVGWRDDEDVEEEEWDPVAAVSLPVGTVIFSEDWV